MQSTCKKGEIWRVGYTRTPSKKSSKKIHVKGKCISATSQSGEKASVTTKKILTKKKQQHEMAREKFGIPSCPKGQIVKEGYKKQSKNGKSTWIAPTCIKSNTVLKREPLFYVEPDRLSKYGYSAIEHKTDTARHTAINKALRAGEKPLSVSRRLNAIATLTKNTNPKLSAIFKKDSEWIKTTREYAQRAENKK